MFKGNYSCNRAVIFEVAIFLLLSLFWTNHQPSTTNHLLHPANHQSPSPQPPNHTTITTTTKRQPRHHYKQPRHVNHNLHNHTTAFPPRHMVTKTDENPTPQRITSAPASAAGRDSLQKHSTKNPDSARKTPSFWKFPAGAGRGEGQGARGDISAR